MLKNNLLIILGDMKVTQSPLLPVRSGRSMILEGAAGGGVGWGRHSRSNMYRLRCARQGRPLYGEMGTATTPKHFGGCILNRRLELGQHLTGMPTKEWLWFLVVRPTLEASRDATAFVVYGPARI